MEILLVVALCQYRRQHSHLFRYDRMEHMDNGGSSIYHLRHCAERVGTFQRQTEIQKTNNRGPTKRHRNRIMELPSAILEQAVDALASLPGVGKRSAMRYALHLLKETPEDVASFAESIIRLKRDIHFCPRCHYINDNGQCPICDNPKRQHNIICVVENLQEVLAIENTQQYKGLYHILGGVISPIDGIGVKDLNIESLLQRIRNNDPSVVEEIILALPTTMEGDTTSYYLNKQLLHFDVKITTIAKGIAIGDSLEYADEVTLGRSIQNRIPFTL